MKDFIELIRNNAVEFPAGFAVKDSTDSITYADFINRVDAISNYFLEKTSSPKVIIDLEQGIHAYAVIIAVLNAGGCYCPVYTDAPADRKFQIVNEFAPDFIIVEDNNKVSVYGTCGPCVITISALLKFNYYNPVLLQYDPEKIIYVIYTSGSTGSPKGVMICRKALNKFLDWSVPAYAAGPSDIWGQFSFLSFDLSIVDIFTCLCSGATLFAMNDLIAKKYRPAKIIEEHKITIWHSVPSAVNFMIANDKASKVDLSSLRLMSFCGEPLKKEHLDFLFLKNRKLIVYNTYGPTEATLFCTSQELRFNNYEDYLHYNACIGKAIPGWNLKLIPSDDPDKNEVIIYGDYVGKGYSVPDDMQRYKSIEINGISFPSFSTGDLVIEKSNKLYFAGRKDRQVKVHGNRIELDEIDFHLRKFIKFPCSTIVKDDSLYSFIETPSSINKDELRLYLKSKLELYKIPNDFYPIKQIPMTANQKTDISALTSMIK